MMPSPSSRRVSKSSGRAVIETLDGRQLLSASAGGFRDVHATNTYNPKTINLRYYVGDSSLEGTVVDAKYDVGTVRIGLLDKTAPLTTANFLKYVDAGKYNNTFVSRSVAGFVVQNGGYAFVNGSVQAITKYAAVQNEFHVSNTRGTIALAKSSGDPNSGTDEFFYNLADNSGGGAALDTQNGGFTVFAKVIGSSGLATVDKIAALPTVNEGEPFTDLPVQNYTTGATVKQANTVTLQSITRVSTVTGTSLAKVTASSNKSGIVTTAIKSGKLILTYSKTHTGTATITINATGVDGSHATTTFKVRVVASTSTQLLSPAATASSDGATKRHDVAGDVLV